MMHFILVFDVFSFSCAQSESWSFLLKHLNFDDPTLCLLDCCTTSSCEAC
jgi:hypothetical protein